MFTSFWGKKENWPLLKRQLVNVLLGKSFHELICFVVELFYIAEFRHHVPMFLARCTPWCQSLNNRFQPL